MLKLNILPQELKDEKRLALIHESLRVLLEIMVIIVAFYAIIFLMAKLILQFQFISAMNETAVSAKNVENYDETVKHIKNQITFIDKIQKDAVTWSILIEYIANNSGNGIKYNKISVSKGKNELTMSGFAENREDLIRLKENLEGLNYFSAINFPLKNFLEKKNINFDISATIKNYEF